MRTSRNRRHETREKGPVGAEVTRRIRPGTPYVVPYSAHRRRRREEADTHTTATTSASLPRRLRVKFRQPIPTAQRTDLDLVALPNRVAIHGRLILKNSRNEIVLRTWIWACFLAWAGAKKSIIARKGRRKTATHGQYMCACFRSPFACTAVVPASRPTRKNSVVLKEKPL